MTMTKRILRKDFLKLASEKDPDISKLDELDRKALEGYAYLDEGADAERHLQHLDTKFSQLLQGQKSEDKTVVRKLPFTQLQRIAATLLLLIIPAYFIFKGPSTNALFTEYFEAPRSTYFQQVRGEEDQSSDPALREAFKLYEMGSFSDAQTAIGKLRSTHPDKQDLAYYEGIAALGAGHLDEAITLLNNCVDISYQNVAQRAPWYLALAYLKKGNKKAAMEWLERSARSDSSFKQQAANLLDRLN